jgi:molybdate transport system substrate-binding protein
MLARLALCFSLILGSLGLGTSAQAEPNGPLVLAAASLQESLTAASNAYAKRGHPKPVISFAASSALAHQIEAGAPADLFISADEPWMDFLAGKNLIRKESRKSFLTNRLVLITPANQPLSIKIAPGFPLAKALGDGRLAMGDPSSVPAGKYGKAALTQLGVWSEVEPKVAGAENVRAALQLVGRGEARAGIVYETDAKVARDVTIAGVFPAGTHAPITYPVAILASSQNPEAISFRAFLLSGAGKAIFHKYGFGTR